MAMVFLGLAALWWWKGRQRHVHVHVDAHVPVQEEEVFLTQATCDFLRENGWARQQARRLMDREAQTDESGLVEDTPLRDTIEARSGQASFFCQKCRRPILRGHRITQYAAGWCHVVCRYRAVG